MDAEMARRREINIMGLNMKRLSGREVDEKKR